MLSARRRTEDELPELHRLLIKVANAEDKVSRLVSRGKYQLDQSEADLARFELNQLVAEARRMLELTPLAIEDPEYLHNRWAETADVPDPEPANPEELR